jgi:hypothetical protein
MKARTTGRIAAVALLGLVCGCGGPLVETTGKVTYKGQPVPSTRVTFRPDNGTRPSNGVTDDEGHFTLRYSRTATGVTRGPHTVTLKYDVSAEEELGKIKPKASPALKAVIARYGDPKTSGLHYEITENGQQIDIELK